jgi:murein DD-endopeptidase MepM/ murein hydrolase activator NlpD
LAETEVSALQQQKWIDPVASGIVTSWGGLRENPVTRKREFHDGMDIACPVGTEVYATRGGSVLAAGASPTYGNYVKLSLEGGYVAVYAHLSRVLVSPGEEVAQGQAVALSGSTGRSTGPHLHYSVFKDGQYQNPDLYVSLPENGGANLAVGG